MVKLKARNIARNRQMIARKIARNVNMFRLSIRKSWCIESWTLELKTICSQKEPFRETLGEAMKNISLSIKDTSLHMCASILWISIYYYDSHADSQMRGHFEKLVREIAS